MVLQAFELLRKGGASIETQERRSRNKTEEDVRALVGQVSTERVKSRESNSGGRDQRELSVQACRPLVRKLGQSQGAEQMLEMPCRA